MYALRMAGLPLSVFLCIFLLSTPVLAQNCKTVAGAVLDASSGDYLAGAHVQLFGKNTGVVSDSAGNFKINASIGDSLLVSYTGFEKQLVEIRKCSFHIFLVPDANNINQLVVKADKIIAEEFAVKSIDKIAIYTNPAAKADPILAVNAMPAATTTDESANISLRGGSPAETGLFLNDVPVHDAVRYSQMNGIGNFSIFNTALVNEVQVFPGNPPLEYGNSTSGVIAIQTEDKIPDQASSSLSLSLAGAGYFTARKLDEQSSLTAFGNIQSSTLFSTINEQALGDLKGFSSVDVGLQYFRRTKNNASLKVFNYSLLEGYQFHDQHPTYSGIFDQQKRRNFTIANWRKTIGKIKLSLNQGFSFSKANYAYSSMDMQLGLTDYFGSINSHYFGDRWEWKAGLNYMNQKSAFSGTVPTFDFALGEHHPTFTLNATEKLSVPEAFAYTKYSTGSWVFGGGIRKNLALENQTSYTSWQGNVSYSAGEFWKFILSVGDYYKFSLPQDNNAQLVLFNTRQYSIDATYEKSSFEANASAFYKKRKINSKRTTISGVELFTKVKLNRNIRFQLSLTSLNAKEVVNGIKNASPYDIHYFLRGNIEYKIQGVWTFTLVFLLRHGSFYTPVEASRFNSYLQVYEPAYASTLSRLPAYRMVDFSASRIFLLRKKCTAIAFLSLGNLPDFKNIRAYTYNADYTQKTAELFSRRMLYFGVVLNW